MTPEQKTFLISVLNSITVKAGDSESLKTVQMIQSILIELNK